MMHRLFALIFCLAAVSLWADALNAQEAPPLREDFRRNRPVLYAGDVVRVTAPELFALPLEGRVVGLSTDSLVIQGRKESEARTAIAVQSIEQLELLDESTSGAGVVVGAIVGIAGGAALGGLLADNASDLVRSLAVIGGAMVGGYGGYWLGIRVERLITGDKWQPIPLSQIQVSFGPTRGGGLGVVVSHGF
jgi:hypothetical protein